MLDNKTRILVVEDERIVAEDIQRSLENLGYRVVHVVSSGADALSCLETDPPHLVLMDIVLAGEMTGVEAARVVRQQYDIPVIYLTAYADKDTLEQAKLTEPFGYILKPFEDRELHSTIETALYKHHMEKTLREREAWLSTTLKSIGDGVIATDESDRVMFMNGLAEYLTGWMEEDVAGRPIDDVYRIVNESDGLFAGDKEGADPSHTHFQNQTLLIARDGSMVPVDESAAPIRDERGKHLGVVRVFKDISRRKAAEKALQKRNVQLKSLNAIAKEISGTLDLQVIMEQALGQVIRISELSRGAMFLFDNKRQSHEMSVHQNMPQALLSCLADLHQKTESRYHSCLLNGTIEWYTLSELQSEGGCHEAFADSDEFQHCLVIPIKEADFVVGSLNLFGRKARHYSDLDLDFFINTGDHIGLAVRNARLFEETNMALNQLRVTQDKLVESEKLAGLGAMASNIVHEIGNPLGAITNSIQVLQKRIHLEGRMKELMDIIGWETERLNRSIEELREFYRPKKYTFDPMDLREVVKKSILVLNQDFELLWGRKIKTRFSDKMSLVPVDSDAMEQVIINLVKNGLQAVGESGIVTVSVRMSHDNGACALLEVEDDGEGIPDEHLKKVFEPYFSTKSRGMGLGMHIVKQIVESHNSQIRIQSQVGEGTRVTIEFPVEEVTDG